MMNAKLSINKACIAVFTVFLLSSVLMITNLYLLTSNIIVIWCGLLFAGVILLCIVLFVVFIRGKLTLFSDNLCKTLDDMLSGEIEIVQVTEEESLFYKINHRLLRLYEVMIKNRRSIDKERADLQELISDISHQVKTPIANLKILDSTLLEQIMTEDKQKEFLQAMGNQLDKLDFLMQAMIKTSRLETGVIALEKKIQPIYDTLAEALGGILLHAEQKRIIVDVECEEGLNVSHDRKWTSEALFNVLDNAVKYTPDNGRIQVAVTSLEMYLKVEIRDNGKGIPEKDHGTIFKRFYRGEEVHDEPGIGIGLYIAREIISMQGGYIKVISVVGQGATFSVFLPYN